MDLENSSSEILCSELCGGSQTGMWLHSGKYDNVQLQWASLAAGKQRIQRESTKLSVGNVWVVYIYVCFTENSNSFVAFDSRIDI